jgi:putative ABC transport system permease protein
MLNKYFKIIVRNLTKHKIYSSINIVGLAVGIACAILIMLWVQYELSYDKFNVNADRLYRVGFTTEQKDYYGFFEPGPLAKFLKDNFPEIEQSTNYSEMQWKLSRENQGFFGTGSYVDPSFFKMFSFGLEQGNSNAVLATPNSVVISKSFANKMFGQSNPVGKSVKLNDQSDVIVTGVFSDVPKTSHMQFDFVIPFSTAPSWMNFWDRKCVNTYVLLRKNASIDEVNKKIYGEMNRHNPTWKNVLYLFPMTKSHLYQPGGTGSIIYVYIFSVFGILTLLVACINFMNLSTARSEKRMKEIGIKKTVGSSRLELLIQFMAETLLLSFISLLIAIVLVEFTLPYLNSILGTHITMIYSGAMILILLGITLLTGIIAGSYPAIYLSSFNPMSVLNGRNSNTGEKRSSIFRNTLVIAQFSFSVFIITCVLFIGNQLNFIQSKNLGFNKDYVLLINTRGALQQKAGLVKEELLKLPFVQSAAVSSNNLTDFEGGGTGPVDWEGKTTNKICEVAYYFVDEGFAKTFQVKMEKGRFFSKDFTTDMSDAVVINKEAAREMGLNSPVGKKLSTWFGKKGNIVGVINDFNTQSLRDEMAPVVFIPVSTANYLCIRVTSTDLPGAVKSIGNKIKEIVPGDPFEYKFLDKKIDELYKTEQTTSKLAVFIAVLAIFISCLGLFGLVSFSSEKRTKEIGIRKVLGASIMNVLLMLSKDFTKWILIANILAWPIAWYAMNKWLQNFAYRIDLNLWIFFFAGLIVFVLALLTTSFQAIKAATANPVKSLKYE